MRGAGGTQGGVGQFFIGFIMMCGGLYLLLNAIVIKTSFDLGYRLVSFNVFGGHFGLTSGMVLIPMMLGVGVIFYNGKSVFGWLLAAGSLTALIVGVIASISFSFRAMTAFDLITILVLFSGGLGLFLRSLQASDSLI